VQLSCIIRLRLLFQHRLWERVASALNDLAGSVGCDQDSPERSTKSSWEAHVTLHYMLLRSLWEGRIGNDVAVKVILKKLYLVMDDTSERGVFCDLRANGGVMSVSKLFPLIEEAHWHSSAWLQLAIQGRFKNSSFRSLRQILSISLHSSRHWLAGGITWERRPLARALFMRERCRNPLKQQERMTCGI